MKNILEQIPKIRKILKSKKERVRLWKTNEKNFAKNIQKIIQKVKLPKGWEVLISPIDFISKKEIMPFDLESYSFVTVLSATKRQGYEIVVLYNKARAKYFSIAGLVPLVMHELGHVMQAAKYTKKYLAGPCEDRIEGAFEKNAEKFMLQFSREFIRQRALESILYCYDKGNWKYAQRMADFWFKDREKMYSGGYIKGMSKEEYSTFLKAKNKKNIQIFIDFYL